MALSHPNLLLVEGHDDLQSIAALMGAYTPWPEDKHKAPVWIQLGKSAEEILLPAYLPIHIKNPETAILGVVFDADKSPAARYRRVASICAPYFDFPADLPAKGLVLEKNKKRFGLWIMPDNSSDGDIEVFLKYLVPDLNGPTWNHAEESVKKATALGCPCHDVHIAKANLYSWLAWQEPPGQSPGRAVTQNILNPLCPEAKPFADWFMSLYKLPAM